MDVIGVEHAIGGAALTADQRQAVEREQVSELVGLGEVFPCVRLPPGERELVLVVDLRLVRGAGWRRRLVAEPLDEGVDLVAVAIAHGAALCDDFALEIKGGVEQLDAAVRLETDVHGKGPRTWRRSRGLPIGRAPGGRLVCAEVARDRCANGIRVAGSDGSRLGVGGDAGEDRGKAYSERSGWVKGSHVEACNTKKGPNVRSFVATHVDQRRRGWVMPWHTRRARILWSLVAMAIILWWQYLILAAAATQKTSDFYPAREVHRLIWWAFQWEDLYYCVGIEQSPFPVLSAFGAGPIGAAVWWMVLCVVRSTSLDRAVLVVSLIVFPGILKLFGVHLLQIDSPWSAPAVLLTGGTGDRIYQTACTLGPFLWTYFGLLLLPDAIYEARAELKAQAAHQEGVRRQLARDRDECHACAYDLRGLPQARICPECGTEQSMRSFERNSV